MQNVGQYPSVSQQNFATGHSASSSGTFGPVYSRQLDGSRLNTQMLCIRDAMLNHSRSDRWRSLAEIRSELEVRWHRRFPEASISAQLRHLRKPQNGYFIVVKRRRNGPSSGLFEYFVSPPKTPVLTQTDLFAVQR